METVDDDTDSSNMILVKVSEISESKETFGQTVIGDEIPLLVFFDDKVPTRFKGKVAFFYKPQLKNIKKYMLLLIAN